MIIILNEDFILRLQVSVMWVNDDTLHRTGREFLEWIFQDSLEHKYLSKSTRKIRPQRDCLRERRYSIISVYWSRMMMSLQVYRQMRAKSYEREIDCDSSDPCCWKSRQISNEVLWTHKVCQSHTTKSPEKEGINMMMMSLKEAYGIWYDYLL
jgi:hypothetical protein